MFGNSLVGEQLVISQEGLISMEIVGSLIILLEITTGCLPV
jgi:hypothetical protein